MVGRIGMHANKEARRDISPLSPPGELPGYADGTWGTMHVAISSTHELAARGAANLLYRFQVTVPNIRQYFNHQLPDSGQGGTEYCYSLFNEGPYDNINIVPG
ncbi:hypothetical protein GGTG_13486 [Gaeumannomyces tritici R3-111a-1]|uniref:Uncharacterized protein n=1 Tax=Gaeumannomyces tritici (strain R3-111a-1) TaxID=644352 RepID=J3PJ04_GAET3|nr:hypothetical protein GGTG_13486 [Gaeumannomyces tritici R3-111a-1]EJT68980.1 hypothetical protein GGTG_13486 [Gaeumannomyces tritici R3-111a-1]